MASSKTRFVVVLKMVTRPVSYVSTGNKSLHPRIVRCIRVYPLEKKRKIGVISVCFRMQKLASACA
jgi:hypothetical protein